MVEETVARFRGQQCDHVDEIVFVGRDIWSTKTRGCGECGVTQVFVREQELENEDTDMIIHDEDSDLAPNEDESTDDDADTTADDDVQEQEGEKTDVETTEIDEDEGRENMNRILDEDFSYRELQSVSSHFDGVKGNQSREHLVNDLVVQEPSALETAVNDVLEDQ